MKRKTRDFKQLTLSELQTIFVMFAERLSIREIARRCTRSPSTVRAVVKEHRHGNHMVWRKMTALERAEHVYKIRCRSAKASRMLKLDKDPELLNYILSKLIQANWSPEQIAQTASRGFADRHISTKTIYTFIRKRRPELVKYLHEKGKKRRQRITHRRGRFKQAAPMVRPISERPSDVEIGDFEGDLVVSKRKGKGGVLSLRNRKTRKHTFILIPDLKAKTVRNYLIIFLMKLGKNLKITLTLDRGSEFAFSELSELERLFPLLKIYYCDAYCPYQKGSVENGHRGFRRFFPKGTDFSQVSQAQISEVENILNNKPMKLHGFKSPNFMWESEYKIVA